ncbi:MAG: phosphatidylserine/phosphatidylglycerophosphate/cardiolipin synthase family protein [Bacteroidetes bacterium]|nr:phosphatidylserine/phosphatidylglycerophosphate/cardiolipin synthase family protein [Bacteroidota bacterium]
MMVRRGTLVLILGSLLLGSCRPYEGAGTFHAVLEESRTVSLAELSRYLGERSNGLIAPAYSDSSKRASAVTFTWDPFNWKRIVAPSIFGFEEIQDLFVFDQERFVRESGDPDFLTAVSRSYAHWPFDYLRQAAILPYRNLAGWGGLFFPPIKHLTQPVPFYCAEFTPDFDPDTVESAYFDPEFQKSLDQETQTELTYGNTLRALYNGAEAYPEKLRLVKEARKFLYVAVMTIVADSTGRELVRLMIERKRAGVDVRLITEDFYTFSISGFAVGTLEREGIPVARVADKRLNQIDRMFHNKFWIRDGEEAILGGMNVLDYENTSSGFDFQNRDTDVLIRGPAVTSLLDSFIRLWKRYDRANNPIALGDSMLAHQLAAERSAGVRGSEHYARWLGDPQTRMNGICRTAVQGDDADPQKIATLLKRYTEQSRHSLYFTTPGVECDAQSGSGESIDSLAQAILEKMRRPEYRGAVITNGIDGGWGESTIFLRTRVKDSELVHDPFWVDIMTPVVDGGGREVAQSLRVTMTPFLRVGMRVYQYINYIHAKEFYFDRLLTGIGSWNFDPYSADRNHESMIFCLDDSLRVQMERHLVLDMVNSVPLLLR